jgi:hypothetical protein
MLISKVGRVHSKHIDYPILLKVVSFNSYSEQREDITDSLHISIS